MRPTSDPGQPTYTKWERRGSAVAHGSGLLVGVPIFILFLPLFLPLPFAFVPNPVVSYMIARSFRRRRKGWGSFQGMQASVVHLIILLLLFIATFTAGTAALLSGMAFISAALLFLYSLWGAWDTLLGYDFRYIGISNFLDRVSQANLRRLEQRRGLFRPYRTDPRPGPVEHRGDRESGD